MTQRELHRAIARATGESLRTITQFGFSIVQPSSWTAEVECAEQTPQIVDWDQLEADRMALAIQA
jgi:hypothetical protein